MYHCFVEGIAPAAAASSCPSGISGTAFKSLTSLPSLLALASSEFLCIFHQPADDLCADRVGQKEIDAEKRHRHSHHDGGGITSARDGQFTCRISTRTSCRNERKRFG